MGAIKFPFATIFGVVDINGEEKGPEVTGHVPKKHPVLKKKGFMSWCATSTDLCVA